jgi:hypothetical protein
MINNNLNELITVKRNIYKKPIIIIDNDNKNINKRVFKFKTGLFTNYKIKAGGILFFKMINDIPNFLLLDENIFMSDLGGKTELYDKTIYDTIAREVNEETNLLVDKNKILDILLDDNKYFYIYHSKYLLFLVNFDKYYNILVNIVNENFIWTDSLDNINNLNPRLVIIKNKIIEYFDKFNIKNKIII